MKKLLITSCILLISCFAFGQAWVPVGTGVDNVIHSLDSANGKLYAGGEFTYAGGVVANNIASWNGSTWSALDSGLTGTVYAMANYNGSLIVAGDLGAAGGYPINSIAMWNGSVWSSLGTGTNGIIYSLAVYNGNLYAGGEFTDAGGKPANYIAEWNDTAWSSLDSGLNNVVWALAVYNGNLYAAGQFTTAGGDSSKLIAKWNGTQWDSLGGVRLSTPICSISSTISKLAVYNGSLYAAGYFTTKANPFTGCAKWNGTAWDTVKNVNGSGIGALFSYKGALFAGGSPMLSGVNSDIAVCYGTKWDSLQSAIISCGCAACGGSLPPTEVYAIAGYNGYLYAGGVFSSAYGNQASYLEQYTGIVGINELSPPSTSVTVYPNPSNGVFNLQLGITSQKLSVEVYNMLGQVVYSVPRLLAPNSEFLIDLTSQAEGIYLYRIIGEQGNTIASGKLIKE